MKKTWMFFKIVVLLIVGIFATACEADKEEKVKKTTPEQQVIVLHFLDQFNEAESSKNTATFMNLFSEDTVMTAIEWVPMWDKYEVKSTFHDVKIKSLSDEELVFVATADKTKVSGEFYPENTTKIQFTLHLEHGEWKLYDIVVLEVKFVNVEKWFNQAIEVPAGIHSEIDALLTAQNKALNAEDMEAFSAMNIYPNETAEQIFISNLPDFFRDVNNTSIENWVVVEYSNPNHVTVLVSVIEDVTSMQGKVRTIYTDELEKVDGKWMFNLKTHVYTSKLVE